MILNLTDGSRWRFAARGRRAGELLSRMSDAMRLAAAEPVPAGGAVPHAARVSYRGDCLTVTADSAAGRLPLTSELQFPPAACADRSLHNRDPEGRLLRDLVALSLVIGGQAQSGGGVLLHGALAEHRGGGVLLLGPSGRGKSTASRRLAPPWRSLSDDIALVLPRRGAGAWSAHPWPTWGSYRNGGGSWDVQRGVDLRGLFFLIRAAGDAVERIGAGRAVCLLMESFEQAWANGPAFFSGETMKALRRTAFDNIGSLAGAVPAFLLHISPTGPFSERIEEALGAA